MMEATASDNASALATDAATSLAEMSMEVEGEPAATANATSSTKTSELTDTVALGHNQVMTPEAEDAALMGSITSLANAAAARQPIAENTTANNTVAKKTTADSNFAHGAPTSTAQSKDNTNNSNKPVLDEEDSKWSTVGIFTNLNATVNSYIDNNSWSSAGSTVTSDNLPDLSKFQRINLEPGTAYRFRLRAINSCGASDWSEVSSFKTCLPGFPGAPSAIKISKSSEGAHLTWEPPPSSCLISNEIVEYSVYLAVKPGKEKDKAAGARHPAQLAFVRVYVGSANQCTVSHSSLAAAHVDCSNKPAIIFRIAARNEKGYGPATQVRWLQDPVQGGGGGGSAAGGGGSSLLSPTRPKAETAGVSPNKRFRSNAGGARVTLQHGSADN